jgi:uncharacterized protein (DUF58 family)
VSAGASVFPLVPRRRLLGLAFGAVESLRRGRGFDLAGSRPYAPGDPVQAIDWKTSARLATARSTDEFVVLERYSEESPRVIVVVDRRPGMALYGDDTPWLSKPHAVQAVVELVEASARAARGLLGYVDRASAPDGVGFWRAPRDQSHADEVHERVRAAPFDASPSSLDDAIVGLGELRRDLPAGSFVFLVSDFLSPPSPETWASAASRGWELVPVVVQDPVWEQDFPSIASLVLPIADPGTGRVALVRLSQQEVEDRRRANRDRLAALLGELEARDLTPVVVSTTDPEEILGAFLEWHERRGISHGRAW